MSPKSSPVGSHSGEKLEFSKIILLELLNWDKRSIKKFAAEEQRTSRGIVGMGVVKPSASCEATDSEPDFDSGF